MQSGHKIYHKLLLKFTFMTAFTAPLIGNDAPHSPILSFQSTYNIIETASFNLQAADADAESKVGDIIQAGALPNPNLIVGLNTIGKNLDNEEENELTVAISQLIELGGKRSARVRYSQAGRCAAAWQLEMQRNALRVELLHNFIKIAAMEQILATTQSLHELSGKNIECVIAQETSGKTSSLETKKAEIACRSIQLKLLKRNVELKRMKNELLALWRDGPADFKGVDYSILEITPPVPFETLVLALDENPEILHGRAELMKAWEMIGVQKAGQIPDVALQIGVTTQKFTQDPTLNVGFSVPLPIFDQNRGNVYSAISSYNQAYYSQEQLEKRLRSELATYHAEWDAAYEMAVEIRDTILPHAQTSYDMALVAFNEGKFNYLDLLDAETTLFSVKQDFIEAAEEYHHKKAEILKLTGYSS